MSSKHLGKKIKLLRETFLDYTLKMGAGANMGVTKKGHKRSIK